MRKKIGAILIIAIVLCTFSVNIYAVDLSQLDGQNWNTNVPKDTIYGIGGEVIAVLQVVGASVAVIMLIVVAIKYLTSSPNDRAEVKKHMVPYIVGALFIFGAIRNNSNNKAICWERHLKGGTAMDNLGITGPARIDGTLLNQLSGVIGVIMAVGTVVAICASIYLGIRYVLSSVEEKADIKKKMVPFVVGVVIFYGATGILKLIGDIAGLI